MTHTHEHTHGEGHDHGHSHADHACDTAHCGSCSEGDCKNETLALLTYMLQHNEHHAQELDQMADNLSKMGMDAACKTIKEAVADFQKGNMRLGLALTLVKGKKVAEGVRFLVVPASQTIYRQALKEGLIDTFMEAGAIVMNPNCSVCWGSCQGVIGENEVLISTGTRNFKGRAGHPSSKVYLGSAATVTASAITGKIALASEV